MMLSDDARQEILREILAFGHVPDARPGDLTLKDIIAAERRAGRKFSPPTVRRRLAQMVEAGILETEMARVDSRQRRVWRKPA